MKRRVTDLEQKLLDNGWKLTSKTYCGKYSQFTLKYEFTKFVKLNCLEHKCVVYLDKHRNKIEFYGVDYKGITLHSRETAEEILTIVKMLEDELFENL